MLIRTAERLRAGETVNIKPSGNSMTPLINPKDEVVVAPVNPTSLKVGDIVLVKVAGTVYLHLIKAIDRSSSRVQIANNHGRINGWAGFDRVYGIVISVAGKPRPTSHATLLSRTDT